MSHVGQDSHLGLQELMGEASTSPLQSANPLCTERGVIRHVETTDAVRQRFSLQRQRGFNMK